MPNNSQMQLSPYAEQYPNATTVPICRTISKCNCTHMPKNIQMQLSQCPYMPKNIQMQLFLYAEEYPNATVHICRRISKCNCPHMPKNIQMQLSLYAAATTVTYHHWQAHRIYKCIYKKHIEHMWKEECQFCNMQKAERNNSCPITSNSDSPENVQTCGIYI